MMGRRRIEVAYPFDRLAAGGAERQMLELARRLPSDRFRVTFLLRLPGGDLAPDAERAGIRIRQLGGRRRAETAPPAFAWAAARSLAAYVAAVRHGRFDVIDAWLYPFYDVAALTKRLSGGPSVIAGRVSLSGFKERFGGVQRTLDRWSASRADAMFANSEAVKADVVRREGIDPGRIAVIRNGVVLPPPVSADERRRMRSAWGAGDDTIVVGSVANYRPGKGHLLLIAAFAVAAATRPSLRLVLVGEGRLRPELERKVASLGLGDRVVLHGAERDARPLNAAFDVAVLASEAEGMPNALLEAAAAARPLLSTAAGGAVEVALDGSTGLVVPVGDVGQLAAALGRLADDAELRARLGAAAREHVARAFGMDRFVAEFADLYVRAATRRSEAS
jgi:glycosyltransferase involved in cell wall biosynthesis